MDEITKRIKKKRKKRNKKGQSLSSLVPRQGNMAAYIMC